ncbi:endonuclease YncB(thermonuclease family) [Sphingobium sp. B1D7B]|uniref:thermonuclease family protein n=1 Tax=Sphingobium sp. B1D7B TaxID=2940578 RepID=UPI002224759A|nr:thermonuclease family protein [Sphingobium sp. B1D7B]MCW2406947.1 endonuclease YncB(thermonuclease family) [Sphingobium sp. B1D7B]
MRLILILLVLIGLVLSLDRNFGIKSPQAFLDPTPAMRVSGCRAIDGDTLRCGDQRIRLLGIDAAELPGHCRRGRDCAPGNPNAQHRVLKRAAVGDLLVRPVKKDRYGRLVAVVETPEGRNLSCAMLEAGATYKSQWDDGNRIMTVCPMTVVRKGTIE